MPIYTYLAKSGAEAKIRGRIEAKSEKDAIELLIQMGYTPIKLEEISIDASELRQPHKTIGRIPARHITIFSRQLASLLKSGVPILGALSIIAEQCENANLKSIILHIHEAIRRGETFSSVLTKFPKVFSSLYVAIIRSGENSGTLPEALMRIADYRARQQEVYSRIKMALVYPILMAIVGTGTIIFMFVYVMPRVIGLYEHMGQLLPLPTRILIRISHILRNAPFWFWFVLGSSILTLFLRRQLKTKTGRLTWSWFKLRLPLFGRLILKSEIARFTRTLELLIKNGIPILNAIDISIPVLENEVIKEQLRKSYKELEQGHSFGRSLKNSASLPLFVSNLIIVGEESGRLDEALGEIADSYEKDSEETIRILSSLLEPLMILGMGVIVGFIVVSMLLPIFEMNLMVR